MTLVHKSVDVRPEIWRRLRVHAELSAASLRDYLAYLIETSEPVGDADNRRRELLESVADENRIARVRSVLVPRLPSDATSVEPTCSPSPETTPPHENQ